jgi:hypothetical protein
MLAFLAVLLTSCSSTSTSRLCRDRLTPINATDAPTLSKARP